MNYMMDLPRVTLATEEGRKYLMGEINAFDPKFVTLNSLMTLIPIELNEGKVKEDAWPEVERFIAKLKRDGRHVLLLHHDNKTGAQYGSMTKTIRFDLMTQLRSPRRSTMKATTVHGHFDCRSPNPDIWHRSRRVRASSRRRQRGRSSGMRQVRTLTHQ